MIAPEHRDSFAQHAAPSAIEHQLRQAKARRRAAQREVEWLAELAGRRAAEIAAGTWPPREPDVAPHTEPIPASTTADILAVVDGPALTDTTIDLEDA